MKQVFLIHAHKDPDQLNALLAQLADPGFALYVHLDRRAPFAPDRVHPAARLITPRRAVQWGGFSQVAATLQSVRQILAAEPAFDKLVFLSGQDFPLLSNARLAAALAGLRGHELIEAAPIGPQGWKVAFRYQYFHREGGSRAARAACALANRGLRALGRQRRFPAGLAPWGGSSWWALSRDCLCALLALAEARPDFLRFCQYVQCPDELFFQTLVMASPFRDRVLSRNFRYIDWPPQGARNPKVLDAGDIERLAAADAHFCRKLDSQRSAALRAWLQARSA